MVSSKEKSDLYDWNNLEFDEEPSSEISNEIDKIAKNNVYARFVPGLGKM